MRLVAPLAVSAAFLATASLAQDASDADIAAMVSAMEQAGCVVTMENGDAVHAASGLGEEAVFAVIAALYDAGQIEMTQDGSVKLLSDNCPG